MSSENTPPSSGSSSGNTDNNKPRGPRGPNAPRRDGPRNQGAPAHGDRSAHGDRPRHDRRNDQRNDQRRPAHNDKRVENTAQETVDALLLKPIERPEPTIFDASGDFAALLTEYAPVDSVRLEMGDRVKAKLIHVSKDTAFFSLSGSQEASMPVVELHDKEGNLTVQIGDLVEAFITSFSGGAVNLSKKIGRHGADVLMLEHARDAGIPVEGIVSDANDKGLEVQIAGTRGFCPISQADVNFVQDPKSLVGKSMAFAIKEIREGGRNVVLSRRAVIENERREAQARILATLEVGGKVDATVTRLETFGVFVDIGGMEALLPNSEASHRRGSKASDLFKVGEAFPVQVLKIEDDVKAKRPGSKRISVSRKVLEETPWASFKEQLVVGTDLKGTVMRLEAYGAFVEIFPGLEGLVHVSEVSHKRIRHPQDALKIGESVTVRLLDVNEADQRISLSIKGAGDDEDASLMLAAAGQSAAAEKTSKPARVERKRGDLVSGSVERIEKFGVFVKLDGGGSALLPASESGAPMGADLNKAFPVGTKLDLIIIDIDEKGRLRVSKKGREQAEERATVAAFQQTTGTNAAFGTFADLFNKQKSNKNKK